MAGKFESYEWKKYKQYYKEENGQVIFNEDTPQFVLDSYALYAKQLGDLQAFPTKKTGGLFGGLFGSKEEKKQEAPKPVVKKEIKSNNGPIAKEFIISRNVGKIIDTTNISNNILYLDGKQKVYTSLKQVNWELHPEYEIVKVMESKDTVMVLWNYSGMDMVTSFWFQDGKITRIQDFLSER